MKRKHGRKTSQVKDPQIKVITDPKKLAWLKAKIDKKAPRRTGAAPA